jgi:uncharacterized protein YkwD
LLLFLRKLPRRLAIVLALIVALVGGYVPTLTSPAEAVTTRERRMYRMVNKARERNGLHKLRLNKRMFRIAHRHSKRMADKGYVYHQSCLECHFSSWSALGENVGRGSAVREVHRLFLRSDGHRRVVLGRKFIRVGIGIVKARGQLWVTQMYHG